MEVLGVLRENFTPREIGKGLLLALVLARLQLPSKATHGSGRRPLRMAQAIYVGGYITLYSLARSWLALVDHYVPEPYLDEVFHIPQAQTYCEGRYLDWDDKITTPPGLYFLSVLYHKLWLLPTCTAFSLRDNTILAILLVAILATVCRTKLEAQAGAHRGRKDAQAFSLYAFHTAVNIALFPALFFFSALYYTDVASTAVVLAAYRVHLGRLSEGGPSFSSDLVTLLLGVGALFMRQTNVFWVVVYMGGLEAVHAVRSLKPDAVEKPRLATVVDVVTFYAWRFYLGEVHDPPLNSSWPHDWALCVLSLGVAALCNPLRVLRQVWPHITIVGLFGAFVFWNGGVVLGDKSNHVATIHLSQMHYIWPLFGFFSAPLLVSVTLQQILSVFYRVRFLVQPTKPSESTSKTSAISQPDNEPQQPHTKPSWALKLIFALFEPRLYYPVYILATILTSLSIVKFNTIIHPFTLADNRHYMFYVFRYTILRPGATRYLLVIAYTIGRWLVWGRLAGCASNGGKQESRASNDGKSDPDFRPARALGTLDEPTSTSGTPPTTSAALLWLLTTALSLITAPLVEPRYFILPWVFWRLLVPAWPAPERSWSSDLPVLKQLVALGQKVDLTLALETAWFLAINLGTMYMFLFRPYVWKRVDGEVLDGGRLQRFMW